MNVRTWLTGGLLAAALAAQAGAGEVESGAWKLGPGAKMADGLAPRPKEVWLGVDTKRAFQHDGDGWVTLDAELALTAPEACQIAVGWKLGESQIERQDRHPGDSSWRLSHLCHAWHPGDRRAGLHQCPRSVHEFVRTEFLGAL